MIATAHLFRPLGAELIELLRGLEPADWAQPTSAAEWSVKDVVAHLLDVDLRRLSSQRDEHVIPPSRPITSSADLVAFLNQLNRTWVQAARRLSPRVLVEELEVSAMRVADLFQATDAMAPATFAVAWAGEEASRMWLDIAREYTERWHHQDQIREAVRAAPLAEPRWLRPVLETSLLALPHAYREVDAPDGAAVLLTIEGASGGEWTLVKKGSWVIESGRPPAPTGAVVVSDLAMCRLLMHRLSPAAAALAVRLAGRAELTAPLLSARAVMV